MRGILILFVQFEPISNIKTDQLGVECYKFEYEQA